MVTGVHRIVAMSSPVGAPTAPPKVPISVGLLSRRSITGAVVVALVALFFIVAVPAMVPVFNEDVFRPGRPFVTAGGIQITPAAGWSLGGDDVLFTSFERAGASLVFTPAVEAEGSPEEVAQTGVEGLKMADGWVVGEIETYVTAAGDHGVHYVGHDPATVAENWIVDNDAGLRATVILSAPESVWASMQDDLEAMIQSIVIVGLGGDS